MAQHFSKLDIKTIKNVRRRSDAFDINLHINPSVYISYLKHATVCQDAG